MVSACLLGEPCRYDGVAASNAEVLALVRGCEVVAVCPEQLGDLPTPRIPCEQVGAGRVENRLGVDLTDEFKAGAARVVELARSRSCRVAILKANSPSCGVHHVYDGTFSGELIEGQGIAAAALAQAGLSVFDESDIAVLPSVLGGPSERAKEAPSASNAAVRKSMKGNKRANTKPELIVRQRLREAGLTGYRLQWRVPGRPDIAWPGKKVALFINGCFWHRCPHCNLSLPKSHVEYWAVKFERNVERDRANIAALEQDGWTVHVIWECQLKKAVIDETLAQLFGELAAELGKASPR